MIRIQFNNKKGFNDVNFKMVSDTSVFLSGQKLKANTSGFKAYRLNGDLLGDYSNYTKCTKEKEGFLFEAQ